VKEREEKEARAITRQLFIDLKKANPALKKLSTAYAKSMGTTLKKNVFIVLKARKAPVRARVLPKSLAKYLAKALIEEVVVSGVVGASASSCTIRLL
jgi:hypothetical protein